MAKNPFNPVRYTIGMENTPAVEQAAQAIGASVAVLISVHGDQFESRLYGRTEGHLRMAAKMEDVMMRALHENDPPADN